MGLGEIISLIKVFQFFSGLQEKLNYAIKKTVDAVGNVFTNIVHMVDTDADGEPDTEDILFSINLTIPDLNDGLCLCNKGNEIGLGQPQLRLLDASDVLPVLKDTGSYLSDGDGFLIDLDDDGAIDDIFYPLPFDYTGDGVPDFQIVVDDDDNGLPDVSPQSPFYPVGSDEYQDIICEYEEEDYTIMTKPLSKYTVTEGILFLAFVIGAFGFVRKLFRRKKVV